MSLSDEPDFLKAPPEQPPVDATIRAIAIDVRSRLRSAMQFLIELPPYGSEQERSVWMWHTALTTIAWDVAEIAIQAAAESSSLRGARALNRMLLEYAARVHLYVTDAALAEKHMSESVNMLRRVVKPLAASEDEQPGLDQVKALIEAGTTKADQPKTREMLSALVASFIADAAEREAYIEFLDAEYGLGNGYVHGSQTSFFDIFDATTGKLHPRTRVLHRSAEMFRCINCLLALLAGIEKQYGRNFGFADFVTTLKSLAPQSKTTSIGTHDTLMNLFGVT